MSTDDVANQKARSFLNAREPSIDYRYRPRPNRQVRLFDQDIREEQQTDSIEIDDSSSEERSDVSESEHETASSIKSEPDTDSILVYLRLRPVDFPSLLYKINESVLVTRRPSNNEANTTCLNNKNAIEKHFSFSAIFQSSIDQREIFERCIGQKIECDESFTILTYGPSGSGKTYTLLGDDHNPGIIPRSLENLFTIYAKNIYPNPAIKLINARVTILDDAALERETQARSNLMSTVNEYRSLHENMRETICADHEFKTKDLDQVSVLIWVSFVEIYNEMVYDLLSAAPSTQGAGHKPQPAPRSMKIIGNDGKVFIKGLTSVYVRDSSETLSLLHYGLQRLNYASTSINANSSRSHCIFIVDMIKYFASGLITQTSYKFCDLAGSERLHKTGNVGSRLKEAQHINTSLMVLGRCLYAASANRKKTNEMIPYRESKLTMLLQAALLGKEKLTMVVNVTPTDQYIEENLNVLNFASIAKNIVFRQPVLKVKDTSYSFFEKCARTSGVGLLNGNSKYIEQLLEENKSLRDEFDQLNAKMLKIEQANESLHFEVERLNTELVTAEEQHQANLLQQEKELRNKLVDSFEKTLKENKKQYEARLQQEKVCQERLFESQIKSLKHKHQFELEDLRDEYEQQLRNKPEAKRRYSQN